MLMALNSQLLDYDAARTRHRKLADKPSDDPMKLPRCVHSASLSSLLAHPVCSAEKELEDARLLFETINEQLLTELPQLLELRIPYLDPSFEAMVRMQARFAEEGYEKMGAVQRYFAEGIREEYAEGQLDAQVSEEARGVSRASAQAES
jgi:amphiphysin